MTVDWNAQSDSDFRRAVREFLARYYPPEIRRPLRRLRFSQVKHWYQILAQHGWIAPNWPVEFGGMGLSPSKMIVLVEEQETYGVARLPDQGLVYVGPILIQQGTAEQRRCYLPKILSGEHIWAQGYSEPNAGSDLASLQTSADLQGEYFVVNGQKTWSTLAQDATHMFLLARTDRNVKKQEGISFLLVSMDTPGIEVRPIRTLAGHEEFCEVYFTDVKVPAQNIVGAVNRGWGVAKSQLTFERLFVGGPRLTQNALAQLRELTLSAPASPALADRVVELELDVADHNALYRRFVAHVRRHGELPPDISMLKVWGTELYQRISELMLDIRGAAAALEPGPGEVDVLGTFYNSRPATIYAGASEIQRNILAKAVLRLS